MLPPFLKEYSNIIYSNAVKDKSKGRISGGLAILIKNKNTFRIIIELTVKNKNTSDIIF